MKKISMIILIIISMQAFASDIELLKPERRDPLKAGVLSALLPGAGQIYNKAYVKGGAFIVVEGLLLGYALKNDHEAQKYYDKWKESESAIDYDNYETYYEKRDNDIWWLGITIFLSTMDAVTDAYLHDFEYQKQKVRLKFKPKAISLEYRF